MASQKRDENIIQDDDQIRLSSAGRRLAPAPKNPSVPEGTMRPSTREAENADDEPEDNGDHIDLEADTISPNQGSSRRDEALPQSRTSTTVMKKINTIWADSYEIVTENNSTVWFCAAVKRYKTVYHSDIRNELYNDAEMNIPPGGPRYKSMLGAGIDDKTSYHPLFDFDGKDRTDRPDCLFCLKRPHTRHAKPAPGYLVWDDMVIIDYQRQPVRALALPLSISSKIGQEGARLEAMLRFNPGIEWEDILARILYRGTTHTTAKKVQNKLNMNAGRFRIDSRLLAFGIRVGNRTLETYLLSIMTPEMVAKNTTKGLVDLLGRDEANFVSLLNRDIDIDESKDRINNRRTPQALKREAHRIRDLKHILKCAHKWAQAQLLWEDQHPIPAPSIYGETTCDAVESIIAFKLGSMTQYRCNGELAVTRHFRLDSAAPSYRFDSPMMEKFFGSWAQQGHLTSQNLSDPYGLLGNPPDDEAQKCLIDFLLEPARSHYRASTLVDDGSEEYRPIFLTDPNGSYWEQLQELQNAFERHWAEVGRMGPPPILHGLLKLDYDSMTWNSHDVPALSLVWQTIDSVTRTFVIWQRQQAESQRTKLCKLQRKFEHDEAAFQRLVQQQGGSEENGEGTDAEGGQDDLAVEEEEGDGDDAEMEADAGAEDLTEVDTEEEEEL